MRLNSCIYAAIAQWKQRKMDERQMMNTIDKNRGRDSVPGVVVCGVERGIHNSEGRTEL